MDRDTTEKAFAEIQRVVTASHLLEDMLGFARDLNADAVTRQQQYVEIHR